MAVESLAASERLTIDRKNFTITFKRTLAARRALVFEAWTRPEHVSSWWDPTGTRLVSCEIDLRVGGAFTFRDKEHSPGFSGIYKVVQPPSRLVFEAMGALGTVELEEERGRTHMVVAIVCPSASHFEQFLKVGVDAGTSRTLDNLVAYMEGLTDRGQPIKVSGE